MLERGEADLALLSNHVHGAGSLRLIAPLCEETLQVVVRRDAGIVLPHDLLGKRISVGSARRSRASVSTRPSLR